MDLGVLFMCISGYEKVTDSEFRLYVDGPVPTPQLNRRFGVRTPHCSTCSPAPMNTKRKNVCRKSGSESHETPTHAVTPTTSLEERQG